MSDLASKPELIPAVACDSCRGSGVVYETHDYVEEPLDCVDCRGEGVIDEKWVRAWIKTLEYSGFEITRPPPSE
jgi:hypothetical protein